MPIIISKTYEVVTDESAEHGEAEDQGFEYENAETGFRELVTDLKNDGYIHPSDSHGVPGWISTDGDRDLYTGEVTSYSLHPGSDPRSQRYWEKALRAAGLIK